MQEFKIMKKTFQEKTEKFLGNIQANDIYQAFFTAYQAGGHLNLEKFYVERRKPYVHAKIDRYGIGVLSDGIGGLHGSN